MSTCEQEHPGYDCSGTCAVAKFGTTRPPSTQVDRLTKLTSQLVGDIARLPGVTLDAAGEAQLVQLLTDAMEQVGGIALDGVEHDHYQGFHLRKCFDPTCQTDHYSP